MIGNAVVSDIRRSALKAAARENQWVYATGTELKKVIPNAKPTHTSLKGGILYVPEGERHLFRQAYAEDVSVDPPFDHFYGEIRSDPYFPLYLDLDFSMTATRAATELVPTLDWFLHRQAPAMTVTPMEVIAGAIAEFWQPENLPNAQQRQCMVCDTVLRRITKRKRSPSDVGEELVQELKIGFHLIWPNLIMKDKSMALQIRSHVAERLTMAFPIETFNWQHIVDDQIYNVGGGLRMIHSLKVSDCPKKHTAKEKAIGADCSICIDSSGKFIDQNSRYRLSAVVQFDYVGTTDMPAALMMGAAINAAAAPTVTALQVTSGEIAITIKELPAVLARLKENVPECLKQCSVYVEKGSLPTTAGYHIPKSATIVATDTVGRSGGVRKRKVDQVGAAGTSVTDDANLPAETRAGMKKLVGQSIDPSSPEWKFILTFIRESMGKSYKYISLRKIVKSPDSRFIWASADPNSAGGRYCQNLGDHHNTASIYFEFSSIGCCQRCYCHCPETRKSGKPCKEYRSPYIVSVPARIKDMILSATRSDLTRNMDTQNVKEVATAGLRDLALRFPQIFEDK